MFKRTWIVIVGALALGLLLSACGGGDLAEDLTPIPTLPQGEEPELVEALQVTLEPLAAADGADLGENELVALGQETFAQCTGCHGAADGAGPAFTGMGTRAASRVDGVSAEEYIHESIVDPGAYVVDGFNNIMPSDYADKLSAQEIQGLVAYIVAESGGDASAADEVTATDEPAADDTEADTGGEESAAGSDDAEGNAENGETLFAGACAACHGDEDGTGPSLIGVAERAAERVEGQSAAEYLHESIVDPGAYVVDGYINIMPPTYGEQFSEQELQDLVAYLLTQ